MSYSISKSQDGNICVLLSDGEKISEINYQWLSNCQIYGIAPVTKLHINDEIVLRYSDIYETSMEDVLKRAFTVEKAKALLNAVCSPLDKLSKYNIDENKVVLDPKYIFVDSLYQDVNYICLPIEDYKSEKNQRAFMRDLVNSIIPADEICRHFLNGIRQCVEEKEMTARDLLDEISGKSSRENKADFVKGDKEVEEKHENPITYEQPDRDDGGNIDIDKDMTGESENRETINSDLSEEEIKKEASGDVENRVSSSLVHSIGEKSKKIGKKGDDKSTKVKSFSEVYGEIKGNKEVQNHYSKNENKSKISGVDPISESKKETKRSKEKTMSEDEKIPHGNEFSSLTKKTKNNVKKRNPITIVIAIVLAIAIIVVSIFFSNNEKTKSEIEEKVSEIKIANKLFSYAESKNDSFRFESDNQKIILATLKDYDIEVYAKIDSYDGSYDSNIEKLNLEKIYISVNDDTNEIPVDIVIGDNAPILLAINDYNDDKKHELAITYMNGSDSESYNKNILLFDFTTKETSIYEESDFMDVIENNFSHSIDERTSECIVKFMDNEYSYAISENYVFDADFEITDVDFGRRDKISLEITVTNGFDGSDFVYSVAASISENEIVLQNINLLSNQNNVVIEESTTEEIIDNTEESTTVETETTTKKPLIPTTKPTTTKPTTTKPTTTKPTTTKPTTTKPTTTKPTTNAPSNIVLPDANKNSYQVDYSWGDVYKIDVTLYGSLNQLNDYEDNVSVSYYDLLEYEDIYENGVYKGYYMKARLVEYWYNLEDGSADVYEATVSATVDEYDNTTEENYEDVKIRTIKNSCSYTTYSNKTVLNLYADLTFPASGAMMSGAFIGIGEGTFRTENGYLNDEYYVEFEL